MHVQERIDEANVRYLELKAQLEALTNRLEQKQKQKEEYEQKLKQLNEQ
jgi:septation ring formation regulator EzrA